MQFNPAQYAEDFKRVHGQYERYAYKVFKKALDEQKAPVIAHLKAYGGITDGIIDLLVRKAPMEAAYQQVYVKVGVLHANWTLRKINGMAKTGGKVFAPSVAKKSLFSEAWARLMRVFFENESAQRVSDVTDTTREKIKQALADSNDLPLSQQASYLEDILDDPAFNRNRSLVIARTESTTAANKGASLGNASADYETNKQWIAIEDMNTRRTHRIADGQVVGNDELFAVGSEFAQYPGDMRLSAKEVIQCRCCVAYVPVLVNGVPVLR